MTDWLKQSLKQFTEDSRKYIQRIGDKIRTPVKRKRESETQEVMQEERPAKRVPEFEVKLDIFIFLMVGLAVDAVSVDAEVIQ